MAKFLILDTRVSRDEIKLMKKKYGSRKLQAITKDSSTGLLCVRLGTRKGCH